MNRKYGVRLMIIPILSALLACHSADDQKAELRRVTERTKVENFALLDHAGYFHELYYYSDMKAVVLFVHGNGCPIVRNSISTLKEIRKTFEAEDVVFLMINANPQDNRETIAYEAQDFDIDFPILDDETQLIAESLNIERTAEVFVIDPSRWEVVYRGPIDDRLGYESQRQKAKHHYLTDALNALLKGKEIDIQSSPVQGCLIAFPDRQKPQQPLISYTDEIVPVLKKRCQGCHQPDGIAPWAMTDYETIRGWSSMMREVIRTKRMPPWHADPYVGEFSNDFSLTSQEAKTLVHWLEAGAPRGEGADTIGKELAVTTTEWALGEPNMVLELEPQKIPATGVLDYQYAWASIPLKRDVWVRAYELQPSNPAVLHHAFVFSFPPSQDAQLTPEVLSPESGMLPYESRFLALYGLGLRKAYVLPQEVGIFLQAGSTALFELHYTPTGRTEVDIPRLALYFAKNRPSQKLQSLVVSTENFAIPPGAKAHISRVVHKVDRDVLVYAILPHMHLRGRWINVGVKYPDGSRDLLVAVPNFHFYWHSFYTFKEPKYLPAGTEIQCLAAHDNSSQNPQNPDPSQWVKHGWLTKDEMLVDFMLYSELSRDETALSSTHTVSVSRYHEFLVSKQLPVTAFKEDMRESQYTLYVGEGNIANTLFPLDRPDVVRIEIERATTKTVWDIQLNHPKHSVEADGRYAVRFRARADSPRQMTVAFAENHPPWLSLGLRRTVNLTTEWQVFDEAFVATADDDNARIHFDLGGNNISVEVSDVTLHHFGRK